MAQSSSAPSKGFIPERYRDLAYGGLILLAVVIFFADALFGGKNFLGESDNVAFFSFLPYLEAGSKSGEFPLWMPYIFAGMPSLSSFLAAGDRTWDVVSMLLFAIPRAVGDVWNNDTARLAMWYTIYGWGVYALLRTKQHARTVALFSSIAAIFSTFVIVWVMIGHSTKPVSLATLPWMLLALERLRAKFSLLNFFILTLPLIVLVGATHPQMMFYFAVGTGIYMLVELVNALITRQGAKGVLVSAASLALAGGLALATHADMFLSTRAYTPYSTRGSAPLVQSDRNTQDASGGNDYTYATNWSFSPEEMMTFLVPNYYGFGNTSVEIRGQEQRVRLYWGQMPFTDAANYMGIGVLILAIIGLVQYRRDPFVIALGVVGIVSLLLSFGKNFPLLYDFFFYNVPAFNKFRAPQIALVLLQFAVPVLAGYGLTSVATWQREATPQRKRTALIIAGACVLFFAWGLLSTGSGKADYVAEASQAFASKGYSQEQAGMVASLAFDAMESDWTATGLLAIAFGALILLVVRGTIKPSVAMPIFVLLLVIDLWRVDKRPYDPQKTNVERTVFRRSDVVDFLKKDNAPYRIADFSQTPPNSWAYHFIEHVHGYSSAKLRVYQDMLDVAGPGPLREGEQMSDRAGNSMVANPFLWNLLNVKYLVSDRPLFPNIQPDFVSQETGQAVYVNRDVLPRAWFVDTVTTEPSGLKILEHLRDATFDPRTTAYVESPIGTAIQPSDSTVTARRTRFEHQRIAFDVQASGTNFLVVSEVYYPEWHAYVDGTEVPMHKTNFLLRGVIVPPGKHTVEFRFSSPSFEQGRTISMAANGVIILVGALGMFFAYRQRKQGEAV